MLPCIFLTWILVYLRIFWVTLSTSKNMPGVPFLYHLDVEDFHDFWLTLKKKKKPFKIINSNHSPHSTSPLLNHVPEHQIHTSLKCFHFSPSRATTCRFLGLYLYSCAILLKLSWNSEQSFTFILNCVHCPTIFTLSTYSARLGYEQVYLLAGQHPHYWNVASLHKGHIVVDIQVHEINEIAYIYILSQYNFIMHNLLHSIKSSREWMSESS